MEGPTPVSALLHAATMVTAGVFLLIRCSFIFEKSELILFFVVLVGSCTALFSALVATFQYDIKKIIAYSTCSQLGYMFLSAGLSNYNITLFHLFNHAFFKALLFLGAGSIISSMLDEQDMRKMGSLIYKMPFTYVSILVGSLAILGFPFLTGFYSKDILLEFIFISFSLDSLFLYTMAIITAFFTAVYSFKLLFFVFIYKSNLFNNVMYSNEVNKYILISLFSLSLLSIYIGFMFSEIFIGVGSPFLENSVYFNYIKLNIFSVEFINPLVKNLPFILSLVGMFLSYIFFSKNILKAFYNLSFKWKEKFYKFFFYAGFFNIIYNSMFLYAYKYFYVIFVKNIEKGFLEYYGPFGIYIYLRNNSIKFRKISPFVITNTLLLMYIFIIVLMFYVILYNILIVKIVYFFLFIYFILTNEF
jgi:NADH-ubiquinone oxidoreductase chain 5